MKIDITEPETPDRWAVIGVCTFCEGFSSHFVLLTNADNVACMCSDCMADIAEAFLKKYGPPEDS